MARGLHWQRRQQGSKLSPMGHLRRLLPLLASLSLAACGSMADFDPPATPPPPPPPPVVEEPEPVAEEVAPAPEATEFDDTDPTALTDFKPHLDPYGAWVEDPTYGMVWVPAKTYVGEDFAPYVSSGHWALDNDDNWVWVSDYHDTFGWVVFHYGRWVWASNSGWVWIPGRRYAPAWVVWRAGDPGYDYVGWAPMPPTFYWRSGAVIWLGTYPPAPYVFCSTTYVFSPHVHTHLVPHDRVAAVAGPTRPYGYPSGGTSKHVLATPHHGPSSTSGHIPSGAVPSEKFSSKASHSNFASPRGMGRSSVLHGAPPRAPFAPSSPDLSNDAARVAPHAPPSHAAPPSHVAPPSHATPPSHAPPARAPSHAAPPSHAPRAPAPRAPAPRAPAPRAPAPSRAAPPPRAPSPRPSTPSRSSPSRSSPSKSGGSRGRR